MRTFETGATRDDDENKLDYEGFFHPLVMERRARYMHVHRHQADGHLRASDNWQKGIPKDAYIKSMFRHFMDVWKAHRAGGDPTESLCALAFNVDGYLYETLKEEALLVRTLAHPQEDQFTGRLYPGEVSHPGRNDGPQPPRRSMAV